MSAVLRAFAEMARHTCPERPTAAEDAATHDRLCDLMAPAKAEWERLRTALDEARRERDALQSGVCDRCHERLHRAMDAEDTLARVTTERDALSAALATLREAAMKVLALPMERTAAVIHARQEMGAALASTASPAEHGARVIAEAEERGAQWGIEAASLAAEIEYFVQWPDPAEVCRTARKEGTR